MARPATKYQTVKNSLGVDPGEYLRELKGMTGAADVKLGEDMLKDAGIEMVISQPELWTWRNKK